MTKLILIRHGFSCGNKEKKFSGQLDVSLDEIGYLQAEEISQYVINNFKVDTIYSSDLSRACDTVTPLAKALNLPVHTLKELREVDVGEWQGMLIEEVKEKYPESFNLYKAKPGVAQFDGGESYKLMLDRVNPAIEKIVKENDGKTVVIGTHGGVIRVLRSAWQNIPLENIETIPHVPNASVTVVEFIDDNPNLRLIGFNDYLSNRTTEAGAK